MKKLPYFPLIVDRWVSGTRYLTLEQTGAYINLICYLYEHPEEYIRDEAHIARILGIRLDRAKRIWNGGTGEQLGIKSKFTRFKLGFYHSLTRDIIRNGGKIRGLGQQGFPIDPDPDPDPDLREEIPPLTPPTKRPKQASRKSPQAAPVFPDGLDKEAWGEYERYRRETRKSKLKAQSVARLTKWLAGQPDQAAVVDQTIRNSWTGLFELKTNGSNGNGRAKTFDDYMSNLDAGEAEEVLGGDGQPVRTAVVQRIR